MTEINPLAGSTIMEEFMARRRAMLASALGSAPLMFDLGRRVDVDEGYVWHRADVDSDNCHGWFLYPGMRCGVLGLLAIDPTMAVINVIGGPEDRPGEIPDGLMFAISAPGLRDVAADLIRLADEMDARP